MDAKSVVDVCSSIGRIHQQRRSKTSVESGSKEIGSSMQRIASNLMQGSDIGHTSTREEATATESTGTQQDNSRLSNTDTVPGDFDNLLEFFVKQS